MFYTQARSFHAQIIKQFIGVLVVIIVCVGVVLPTITNLTELANLSGIEGMVVSYLGTFVAIALLLVITGIF